MNNKVRIGYNVEQIPLYFMKDYLPEQFDISNYYLNYSPVIRPDSDKSSKSDKSDNSNKSNLRKISFERRDPTCYLKLRNKWVYVIKNIIHKSELIYEKLGTNGFTKYRVPSPFLIKYITGFENKGYIKFIVYFNLSLQYENNLYLIYDGILDELGLTKNINDATVFTYKQLDYNFSYSLNKGLLLDRN